MMLLALLCAEAASAQVTFRSDVNLVTLPVRVTDVTGREMRGLTAADFTVLEDGLPQKIAFFAAEHQPITLFVLLDASSSMRSSEKYATAKAALERLLNAAPAGSQLFLCEFSDRIESLLELTAGGKKAIPVPALRPQSGGTALYDAISFALCRLGAAQYPRQVLVVATDGADQDSRLRLPELIETIHRTPTQVFVLGQFNSYDEQRYEVEGRVIRMPDGTDLDNPLHVFRSIARLSGAKVAYPTTENLLIRAVERIRTMLESQYFISYYLPPSANQYRRIQVKVSRFGARVQTRPGIAAPKRPEPASSSGGCAVTAKDHPYPYEIRTAAGPDGLRVYRDDFRDPASGWPKREFFHYGPDGYEILKNSPFTTTFVAYGSWWENFRASVTVSFAGNAPESAAGLVFCINDARRSSFGNYLGAYSLLLSGDRKNIFLLGASEPFLAPASGEVAERLGVECRRGEIRILLNGRVIQVLHDHRRTSGMVGLQLTGAGKATFRDLVVEEVDDLH